MTEPKQDERVAELEQQLRATQEALSIAESNELHLHRALSPYLNAEIRHLAEEVQRYGAGNPGGEQVGIEPTESVSGDNG